jgi:hypothetical protein
MTKTLLLQSIITLLEADLALFTAAARTAHEAATHEECLPDKQSVRCQTYTVCCPKRKKLSQLSKPGDFRRNQVL